LESELEGLLHISELAERKVTNPEEVVAVNEKVVVKIIKVDPEARKIGLSLKEVTEEDLMAREEELERMRAEDAAAKAAQAAAEAAAEAAQAGEGAEPAQAPAPAPEVAPDSPESPPAEPGDPPSLADPVPPADETPAGDAPAAP
ncbi:MAG: S1 RNA-binding domain-containing protein, partial [Planctomycetes bacterium]|nr:S1 RNA-binding domain-containing protein [Planctomycetota bacterium]